MTLEQQVREIHRGINELKGFYSTPVWVSQDKILLFTNWTRGEIESFRRNNPNLCKNMSKGVKASWVYDKSKLDINN